MEIVVTHLLTRPVRARLALAALAVCSIAAPAGVAAREHVADPPQARPLTSLANLAQQARDRTKATPRVELAAGVSARSLGSPDAPSFVRALGAVPHAMEAMVALPEAVLFKGTVAPQLKAAMGVRIAQVTGSPYLAAHMLRVLKGHERGGVLRSALEANNLGRLTTSEQAALRYAEALTRSVNIAPSDFDRVAVAFNDSEIVELTMAVCFFNFFARYVEALNLPVEAWALDGTMTWPALNRPAGVKARVALLADDEITAAATALAQSKDPEYQKARNSLRLGLANSQRAMLRVPGIQQAWRAFGSSFREKAVIGRDIQLQVSFAVSTANECRYCTLHQVQGLRGLGVDPVKLQAMRKDDSVLTPRELAAVRFARKVTDRPAGVTDEDYAAIRKEFGDVGALEVLLQTCTFAFMNRFTDGLQLPSEDEAIKVYQETYGAGWTPATSQQ
jgi:AhpD family alkylhydroperoxidase